MAATQTVQAPTSDILNWQLRGIRAERDQIKARLEFLDREEARLISAGMTGQTKGKAKAKAKAAGVPQRTRVFTEEQKRKMSEAATRRWERKRAAEAAKQQQAEAKQAKQAKSGKAKQTKPEPEQAEGYAPPVEIPNTTESETASA